MLAVHAHLVNGTITDEALQNLQKLSSAKFKSKKDVHRFETEKSARVYLWATPCAMENVGSVSVILSLAFRGTFNANVYDSDVTPCVTGLAITSVLCFSAGVGTVTAVDDPMPVAGTSAASASVTAAATLPAYARASSAPVTTLNAAGEAARASVSAGAGVGSPAAPAEEPNGASALGRTMNSASS